MGATAYIERSWLRHVRCKHPFFAEENLKRIRNGLDLSDHVRNESGECNGNFESHLPELQKEHLKPVEQFVGNILLSLREEHKIPSSSCAFIADKVQGLLDAAQTELSGNMMQALKDKYSDIDIFKSSGLEQVLCVQSSASRAGAAFSSHKNDRFVSQNSTFVSAIEYQLGSWNGRNDTFQCIPIIKTLKLMLKHENVLAQIFNNHASDEKLRNICDGSRIRDSSFFFLPIFSIPNNVIL